MDLDYIIVQAGGKGTRMEKLTRNKPKVLVSVEGIPMIFHMFRKFPTKKFIIIGDYKFDVLEKYLKQFAEVEYRLVHATGHKGTCAGLNDSLKFIPEDRSFLLIWCDIVLPRDYELPKQDSNIVGISKDFTCRWRYENGKFEERESSDHGVAGFFIFKNKSYLKDVPEEGEFVRWLQSGKLRFEETTLYKAHEYGLFTAWDSLPKLKTRPFNQIIEKEGKLYKIPLDAQGRSLAVNEQNWYRMIVDRKINNIPRIFSFNPICMEKVNGKNIYCYSDISNKKKKEILKKIIDCLREIHMVGSVSADEESFRNAYIDKTYERLKKVRYLVPFANESTININGRKCRNIFYNKDKVEAMIMKYLPKNFCLIHGDCTFSNIMLNECEMPILIDPRGYFGNTELYGDVAYDWVKLYYSIVSNYDQFNLRRFDLFINEKKEETIFDDGGIEIKVDPLSVKIEVESNNWEDIEDYFFELLKGEVTKRQMRLFLSIIWLSLTTYAWDDYDSICGAFYKGIYYLEDALLMREENERVHHEIFVSAYEYYFKNKEL